MAQMVKHLPAMQETRVQFLGQEEPLEKAMAPTPVFLPGESHGQRSLEGYSPWDHKESDMIERLTHTHTHTHTHTQGLLHVTEEEFPSSLPDTVAAKGTAAAGGVWGWGGPPWATWPPRAHLVATRLGSAPV